MPIVNVTLSMTEADRDQMKELAQEIGVNPNAFISACSIYGSQNLDEASFNKVAAIMDNTSSYKRKLSANAFYGAPAKQQLKGVKTPPKA